MDALSGGRVGSRIRADNLIGKKTITRSFMEVDVKQDCAGVDWRAVSETLKCVGMAYDEPDVHRRAFEASHTTVFVYHANRLIGFGRAISDGVYQAAIYDCAVLPEFQGKGIGTTIMKNILLRISHCNVILYASPGKEGFYQTLGFRKMKTGMAQFKKSVAMRERGFTE
jgi:ribosomal protein S18 acetylase RimI-like enzyme